MTGRRTLVAAVALLLAVVAGGASYLYLHDVQKRAYNNAALVPVYTVAGPIAKGTSGQIVVSKGLVKRGEIPQQFLPADAVTDLATIRNEIAVANLSSGQVLVSDEFASPAVAASTASQAIPKGDVAITVSIDAMHAVAGMLQPGDEVDILVEMSGAERFLYQNVPILAIGSSFASGAVAAASTPPSTAATSGSGLITFAVPPAAAQRIALAQSGGGGVSGSLYLALVPPGNKPVSTPPVNGTSLIPATLTPKG